MKYNPKNRKVIIALSGGVDSAVSAALLQKEGYQLEGIFMKNWSGETYGIEGDCPWEEDQEDALKVCEKLGIKFRSVNFENEYRETVLNYFFETYKLGKTPNPDIMCNKEIKFKIFFHKALELEADFIATGHYARNIYNQSYKEFELLKGVDSNKDQTYFLYNLNQKLLSKTIFPIGSFTKEKVRLMAKEFDLPVANKKDSQGICFVGKINVREFLKNNIQSNPGKIVDIDTQQTIGQHDGAAFFTIGQREGLGIGGSNMPYYVTKKDIESNTIFAAKGKDHPSLFTSTVELENFHQISTIPQGELQASIRYRQKPQSGNFNIEKQIFEFSTPQRAVTSGQSLVLYRNEVCLGGGVIR